MDSKIFIKNKSFFELKKDINSLVATYPFLNLRTLARSNLGREIYSITLGKANEYVYFLAPFCGNEGLISTLILRFLEELAFSLYKGEEMAGVNIRKATVGKGIIFIPIINPDGQEIALKGYTAASYLCDTVKHNTNTPHDQYKYNLRGVYLENNFYKSAVGAPYKNNFGGYSAFSESESLSIAENLRRFKPRQVVCLNKKDEKVGVFAPQNNNRTKEMADIIKAIYPKPQEFKMNDKSFYSWVKNEFSAPCFTVGLSGITENTLMEYYNFIKELLVLMLIM